MEIEILGPVRLRRDGQVIEIPSRRERAALGLLALEAGRFVSADRLIDAVWGDDLPSHPSAALRTVLSRLRGSIAPATIDGGPAGYRLSIDPQLVDAGRLARLPPGAVEWREVLQRWRGDPVPELEGWEGWIAYVEPLRERRRRLEEDLARLEIDEGPSPETIARLRRMVVDEPLREHRWALLAEALVARGERAEAVREIRSGRRRLTDDLGAVVLPELDELEGRIADGGPWTVGAPAWGGLVGREGELAALRSALAHHGLVTVVGPPGVGKTRLAHELAESWAGAMVADLSTCDDEETLVARLCVATGVVDVGAETPTAALGRWLTAGPRLVVLDDCDRVVTAVGHVVSRILASGSTVLATGRAPLGLPGEHVVVLAPLGERDAAVLLRRRVGPASADPAVTDALRVLQVETAGIPLAIELAATEARTSGVVEAAERYAGGGERRADEVLQRSIERGYERLGSDAARLLRRLAAYAGTFSVPTAAALVNGHEAHTGDLVDELARHSLVVASTVDGRARYRLLPPVRRAVSRLATDDDRAAARQARRHHVEATAERLRAEWCGPRSLASMSLLRQERDDIRSAMADALAGGDVGLAMTVCGALLEHAFRQVDREVFDWAEAALALPGADEHPEAERVHALAGYAAWYRGSGEGMARQIAAIDALPVDRRPGGFATSLRAFHGTFFHAVPDGVLGRLWIESATGLADPWWRVYHVAVLELVGIRPDWPRPPRAVAAALADELDDPTARLFVAWGRIGELKDDLPGAIPHLEWLLTESRRLGDVFIAGAALLWMIAARFALDPAAVRRAFVEWLDHWAPTGDRIQLLTGLSHLRVLLQAHGMTDTFEIADELVRTWSISVWHVAGTEPNLGPRECRDGDVASRAVVGAESFLDSIARLREALLRGLAP